MTENKSFKKLSSPSGEFITGLLLTSLRACQSRRFDICSTDCRGYIWDGFLQGWPGSSTHEEEGMAPSPCSIYGLLQPGRTGNTDEGLLFPRRNMLTTATERFLALRMMPWPSLPTAPASPLPSVPLCSPLLLSPLVSVLFAPASA